MLRPHQCQNLFLTVDLKRKKIAAGTIAVLIVLLVVQSIGGNGGQRYSGVGEGRQIWVIDGQTGQAKFCQDVSKGCSAWMR